MDMTSNTKPTSVDEAGQVFRNFAWNLAGALAPSKLKPAKSRRRSASNKQPRANGATRRAAAGAVASK